jgi:hypothetical protein
MKKLPDPRNPHRDLWDASRIVDPGVTQTFVLGGLRPHQSLKLVFRSAPPTPQKIRVTVGSRTIGELELNPSDRWIESSIPVSAELVTDRLQVTLTTDGSSAAELFHLWATQRND